MKMQGLVRSLALAAVCAAATSASAQITIPANNLGTDGAFNAQQNYTVPLPNAVAGEWDQPGDGLGRFARGVYDADKWAVVFKYSSVSISPGVTVEFTPHPSGAPVVWLVSGDVTINGHVNLNGRNGSVNTQQNAPGGPGGFRGGRGADPSSPGFGPGGGGFGEGGGYGEYGGGAPAGEVGGHVYGTPDLVPLIGGSGGGTGYDNLFASYHGGGGGGGAILIVAAGTVTINGSISANGGNGPSQGGGGSGGGIRIVCNTLAGSPTLPVALSAMGGGPTFRSGGSGRIRTERNNDTFAAMSVPERSVSTDPITVARIWPDASEPKVTAVSLGNRPVPTDPRGNCTFGNTDVEIPSTGSTLLTINAQNVPLASQVWVRLVTPGVGETRVQAAVQGGSTFQSSVWRVDLSVPNGCSLFTVSVVLP